MRNFFYPVQLGFRPSFALLVLRLVCGLAFMLHGWPKIRNAFTWMGPDSPIPGIFQGLAAFSEFAGGFAWMIGLLTPLASLGMFFTMAVAVFFHASNGDPFVSMGGASYEPAAVYLVISFLLLWMGAGKFSLDAVFFKKN